MPVYPVVENRCRDPGRAFACYTYLPPCLPSHTRC